jgi:dephospho-CoA kinase
MLKLGLTGSIGMGKSTIANMFRDEGVPVWDADETVHRLYAHDEALKTKLTQAFGDVLTGGAVDRAKLSQALKQHTDGFARLNAIVHPATVTDRQAFFAEAQGRGEAIVLADIPLMYETGAEKTLDKVIVVSAPYAVQKARVLVRPGMTEEKFNSILSQQMPDAEKRNRAHYVIDTSQSLEDSRSYVRILVAGLRKHAGQITRN